MIIPQKTAKKSIEATIVSLLTLKLKASNVPPMGVKNKGVRQAIPQIPIFFHKRTANRVRLENNLGFSFLKYCITFATWLLKRTTISTVNIIPTIVQMAVSNQERPNPRPAAGPIKNLIAVEKITTQYFSKGIFNKFICLYTCQLKRMILS